MRIDFKNVRIENFKSIADANIALNEQGIVKVLGINDYESNASSNGAGKSSIFMAIFWALYGRDPKGITNPTNRYTKGECCVTLDFVIDKVTYKVVRSFRGSQLCELYINGQDKSARNRTDTDRILKEDILKMSPDIFLSLIYLSQGFSNRLTSLTPTARKDRLEQLTGTSDKVDSFSDILADYESARNTAGLTLVTSRSQVVGYGESLNKMIAEAENEIKAIQNRIDYYEDETGKRYYRADISDLQSLLAEYTANIDAKQHQIDEAVLNYNNLNSEYQKVSNDLRHNNNELSAASANLAEVNKPAPKCPTCHQPLPQTNAEELRLKYKDIIDRCTSAIKEMEAVSAQYKEAISKSDEAIKLMRQDLSLSQRDRTRVSNIISKIPLQYNVSTTDIEARIAKMSEDLSKVDADIKSLDQQIVVSDTKLGVIKHCRQLVTKAFRSYLLESAIRFLNERLAAYSKQLFSNSSDIVRFDSDSNKIELHLGDVLYDTLSGGEARKADLAVVLAQRDLASEVAGTSCNILVLDEIMESMDETATQVTLGLLEQTSQNVESMFIISHNNYAIPADSKLYVKKGADRVASVYYSMR